MNDMWYVPGIARNLFSVSVATEKGCQFLAKKDGCKVMHNGQVTVVGKKLSNKLFKLDMRMVESEKQAEVYLTGSVESLQLWHEQLGYQNNHHVKKFLKS